MPSGCTPASAGATWRGGSSSTARVHGEVAAFYAAADVFVLPSMKEPYGTVYGEAMAAGLPVIGWRAGNLPYLAEHEREGLIVAPGDRDALAGAMMQLVEDEPLRRRLGAAARTRSLSRPTWEETAATIFGTIRRVAEQLTARSEA
jgi:glycosyltransferase involved in cell wall biosynthesis